MQKVILCHYPAGETAVSAQELSAKYIRHHLEHKRLTASVFAVFLIVIYLVFLLSLTEVAAHSHSVVCALK